MKSYDFTLVLVHASDATDDQGDALFEVEVLPSRCEFHQQVDITCGMLIATCKRPKERQPIDAQSAKLPLQPANPINYILPVFSYGDHAVNIRHGG